MTKPERPIVEHIDKLTKIWEAEKAQGKMVLFGPEESKFIVIRYREMIDWILWKESQCRSLQDSVLELEAKLDRLKSPIDV